MRLPQFIDYQQAVQFPDKLFVDPALRRGRVKLDQLGGPTAATGGFAITFDVTVDRTRFAVRCFRRLGDHLERRYSEIAEFIRVNRAGMDFLVDVEYQHEGIRVDAGVYPIVRMSWVDGTRLDSWVDDHLAEPDALDDVRAQLARAVRSMSTAGVAHGDLQHGNVMVDSGGRVRLVDYDGMYLPALGGLGVQEVGHRHYQHPERGGSFDASLDRFSAAVIDLSLDALRLDPGLWSEFNNSDNLIFVAEDFASPEKSALFTELLGRAPLAERARRLRDACGAEFAAVPSILAGDRVAGGPWRSRAARVRAPEQAVVAATEREALLGHLGDEVTVVGRVVGVKQLITRFGKPMTFVDFGDYRRGDFGVVAFEHVSAQLKTAFGADLGRLKGSWVSVTGMVTPYKPDKHGTRVTPQIQLKQLRALRSLDEDRAADLLAPKVEPSVHDEPTLGRPQREDRPRPRTDPPADGLYRWSAPPEQPSGGPVPPEQLSDDIDEGVSRLYSTPGFVWSPATPAPPRSARETPRPAAAQPAPPRQPSPYRLSNPPRPASNPSRSGPANQQPPQHFPPRPPQSQPPRPQSQPPPPRQASPPPFVPRPAYRRPVRLSWWQRLRRRMGI
ncbi:DNA-binding protein [Umezawaea tangerina]|uniref:Protein kinase domain-containing protein n=1 Tax=Umezawaea tangerina TaxID=84725 RepID=A0A2T0S8J1_9PSEU|nr:DNA-binding protein [Umezawaea tangerina]PRY29701.1 hypothetical protein CLV43_12550 [Umezawaea tangerina]